MLKFGPSISDYHSSMLTSPITCEEIRNALFSMNSNKSPGLDGFSSGFFKYSWDIISADFCSAILKFFQTSKVLTEVNPTLITLMPKSSTASHVGDFCPISLCNVVYKTIKKVLAIVLNW